MVKDIDKKRTGPTDNHPRSVCEQERDQEKSLTRVEQAKRSEEKKKRGGRERERREREEDTRCASSRWRSAKGRDSYSTRLVAMPETRAITSTWTILNVVYSRHAPVIIDIIIIIILIIIRHAFRKSIRERKHHHTLVLKVEDAKKSFQRQRSNRMHCIVSRFKRWRP